MELGFVLDGTFVQSDNVHVDDELVDLFQRPWNACQSSLDFLALYLSD